MQLGDGYDGEAGRKRFLAELPALALVDRDPPTSSPQRWMSFQISSRFLDRYTELDRMLLSFVCIRKGWIESLDELMPSVVRWGSFDSFAAAMKKAKVVVPSLKGSPPVADASVADVAAALAAKAKPSGNSTAAQIKADRAQVAKDIKKARNTMHFGNSRMFDGYVVYLVFFLLT